MDRGIVVAEKRYRPPLLPLFVLKNEKGRKVAHRSRPLAARGRITVGKIKRKTREKKKREISGRDVDDFVSVSALRSPASSASEREPVHQREIQVRGDHRGS